MLYAITKHYKNGLIVSWKGDKKKVYLLSGELKNWKKKIILRKKKENILKLSTIYYIKKFKVCQKLFKNSYTVSNNAFIII